MKAFGFLVLPLLYFTCFADSVLAGPSPSQTPEEYCAGLDIDQVNKRIYQEKTYDCDGFARDYCLAARSVGGYVYTIAYGPTLTPNNITRLLCKSLSGDLDAFIKEYTSRCAGHALNAVLIDQYVYDGPFARDRIVTYQWGAWEPQAHISYGTWFQRQGDMLKPSQEVTDNVRKFLDNDPWCYATLSWTWSIGNPCKLSGASSGEYKTPADAKE